MRVKEVDMLVDYKKKLTLFFAILLAVSFFWSIKSGVDMWRAEQKAKEFAALAAQEAKALAQKTAKAVNPEHLRCLATNIYYEAGSEPFMGQVAVARVVVNRIRHGFASNPCRVVYQTSTVPDLDSPSGVKKLCQFSWVCENKTQPARNTQYLQAEDIARQVLLENKWREDIPANILFFHSNAVDPGWGYKKAMVIGNHIFYTKK